MLDIRLIREDRATVERAMALRGIPDALGPVIEADERYRNLLRESEDLRARHNQASKELGRAKEKPQQLLDGLRTMGEQSSELQRAAREAKETLDALLLELPNIPHASVPEGADAAGNVVVRTCGTPRHFDFPPLPHWDIGERLDIIDFARGVKLSGSRFYVLKGLGARLQRALISLMLDLHTKSHGYTEVYLPFMLHKECMVGSGNLPKFADNLYHDAEEDYWFVPTAEVPLTNLHRDEILDVFEKEPELTPGLTDLSNVVLAPHIGSGSWETRTNMAHVAVRNIIAALDGKTPPTLVNKPAARRD